MGSDADIAIFDPNLTRTIDGVMLKSNADYSVYEGWQVTGWPVLTIRRGEIVFRDGEVHGEPGTGRSLRRGLPRRSSSVQAIFEGQCPRCAWCRRQSRIVPPGGTCHMTDGPWEWPTISPMF